MLRKRRYVRCGICAKEMKSSESKSTDVNFLTTIEDMFKVNMDSIKASNFYLCDQCYDEASIASKFHAKCMNVLKVSNSQLCCDASIQTESPKNIIIVNGLPKRMTEQEVIDLFSKYSTIQHIYRYPGYFHDNFARITFINEEDASRALGITYQDFQNYHDDHRDDRDDVPLMITNISEDTTPIDILPNDCLRLIFLKIDNVDDKMNLERVCKHWKKVARKSWNNITKLTGEGATDLPPAYVESIMIRCSSFLTNLDLMFERSPKSALEVITKHCSNLENIRLILWYPLASVEKCSDRFRNLLSKSSKMLRLSLSPFDVDNELNYLDILPSGMKEIILFVEDLDDEPSATVIDLSRFHNLVALDLIRFNIGEDRLNGIENLINLERLSLGNSTTHPSNINKIIHFTKLTWLEIPDCQIDDITFSQILQNNQGLHHLDISNNMIITDQSFQYVQRLPLLETLKMNNLLHVTGRHLKQMPSLLQLDCNGCRSITDIELIILIDSSPKLRHLEANGSATDRLIASAEETVKLRESVQHLWLHVGTELYEKFRRTYNHITIVQQETNSEEMSPYYRDRWYSK